MAQAIEVRDVVVALGGRRVLDGLSFAVPSGQVTGLLGPSGCGKTTLMRCVVGVQRVDRGEVRVLGMPAGSPPTSREPAAPSTKHGESSRRKGRTICWTAPT